MQLQLHMNSNCNSYRIASDPHSMGITNTHNMYNLWVLPIWVLLIPNTNTQWVLPIPTICITYPPIPTIDLFTPTPSKLYHPTTCTVGTRAEWLPAEQICHRLTSLNSPPYTSYNAAVHQEYQVTERHLESTVKVVFQYHQDAMDSSDPRCFL